MLLETISHCWLYPRILSYALSAYLLHPPQRCKVRVTICHAPAADDPATAETLDFFRQQPLPASVEWRFREFDRRQLCRRAIGRNVCCLNSTADFVLLGDVDYIFGPGALDTAAAAMQAACSDGPKIMYPRRTEASIDHADGDAEIERVSHPQLIDIDPSRYQPKRLGLPIGGAQWVPGDFARQHGYLRDSRRFQRPVDSWMQTKEDPVFRRYCGEHGLVRAGLDIPNVYRIRHSARGRHDIGVQL